MKTVSQTLHLSSPNQTLTLMKPGKRTNLPQLSSRTLGDLNRIQWKQQAKIEGSTTFVSGQCEHRSSRTLHLSWNVCPARHLRSFRQRLKNTIPRGARVPDVRRARPSPFSPSPSGEQSLRIDPWPSSVNATLRHQNGNALSTRKWRIQTGRLTRRCIYLLGWPSAPERSNLIR